MIFDSNLVLYACVSKGSMILAELTFGNHDLETLALQCLDKTPNHHEKFSQTTADKTYSFLMDDPFVYFGIFKKDNGDSQGIQFLELVKEEFVKMLKNKSIDDLTPHCLHDEFDPVFRGLVVSKSDDECSVVNLSPDALSRDSRNGSIDSASSGNKVCSTPLLGRSSRYGQKKKKKMSDDEFVERRTQVGNGSSGGRRKHSQKINERYMEEIRHHEAQRKWWDNVRIVLLVDLAVCCLLFLVWLWICRGFECIAS